MSDGFEKDFYLHGAVSNSRHMSKPKRVKLKLLLISRKAQVKVKEMKHFGFKISFRFQWAVQLNSAC